MKDTKSLLLGLMSIGLIGTWIYHLYDKSQYETIRSETFRKDSIALTERIKDSLQRNYTASLDELDSRLDSSVSDADSLKVQLDVKMAEIIKLRNEINSILKKKEASGPDILLARNKIKELQSLVDDLKNQKLTIEEEKQNLFQKMNSLNGDITSLQEDMKQLTEENKKLSDKLRLASLFVASEIQLTPVALKKEKEQETSHARNASKLVVSFTVQNNSTQFENAELFIVIVQPDGSVLMNEDVWASSTTLLSDGKKIPFTREIKFEYLKGEAKKLIFSLTAPEYLKGTYTLKIFHNGHLIGQTYKTLK